MENKEKKARGRERAQRAVVGAGVIQAIFAVTNIIAGARTQDILNFVLFGLASLALAVFFVLFKHPVWGILNTFLYVIGRILTVMGMLVIYAEVREGVILVGIVLGAALSVALTAYFIYADYQAVVLHGIEQEQEE